MTVRLSGVEIFAGGEWNGIPFSDSDVDVIVSSFTTLDLAGRIPVKLSHDGPDARVEPGHKLAFGWVQKVWRAGSTILADVDVPDKVNQAIKDGYLKFVSCELLKNVKADTRIIPWVLDAVALLGSEQPAVGILKELKAVFSRRVAGGYPFESRVQFKLATSDGDSLSMTEAEIAAMKAENDRLRNEAAANKTEATTERTARETFAKTVLKEKADARRTEVKGVFETAISTNRILPKVRESFMKNLAPAIDDDAKWAEFNVSLATECIDEMGKPASKNFGRKEGGGRSDAGDASAADAAEMENLDASGQIAVLLSREAAASNRKLGVPEDYDHCLRAVFRRNPELVKTRGEDLGSLKGGA